MALIKCHECSNEVSTEAQACPKCGAKVKKKSSRAAIVVILIIGILVYLGNSGTSESSAPSSNSTDNPAPEVASNTCKDNYKVCQNNEDLINNFSKMSSVKADCKVTIDSHVLYGTPEWNWIYFGTFHIGNDYVQTGIVKIFDDQVKIQNGFGAMKNTKVACTYDLDAEKVLEVLIDGNLIVLSTRPEAATIKSNDSSTEANVLNLTDKYALDVVTNTDLNAKFRGLLGDKYEVLVNNLMGASTPMQLIGDYYIGSACAPHACSSDEAAIAVNKSSGAVFVALLSNEKVISFPEQDDTSSPLNTWIAEHKSTPPAKVD